MSPTEKLLSRLDGVRRTAPDRWSARSPTREDRSPSLSIRELPDGALLVHDFGGSPVADVLAAIGMELSDLFPERQQAPGGGRRPERRPFSAADLLALAAHESAVACVVVDDLLAGREGADVPRLIEAGRRLGEVAEVSNGKR